MTRKIIAIDIDDVLAEHAESFIEFSNKNCGTNFTIEDYSDNWTDVWDVDDNEFEHRRNNFRTDELFGNFAVKNGSKNALIELGKENDLYIVTARPKHLTDSSKSWINRHFNNIFKDIHFVPIWEPNNKISKFDICRQIGADYLIDDLPKHCNIAAESGIKAILFGNYAWNRNDSLNNNVTRCENWDKVIEYFTYIQ